MNGKQCHIEWHDVQGELFDRETYFFLVKYDAQILIDVLDESDAAVVRFIGIAEIYELWIEESLFSLSYFVRKIKPFPTKIN